LEKVANSNRHFIYHLNAFTIILHCKISIKPFEVPLSAATAQQNNLHAAAVAGAGGAVPEDALPGRVPPRRSGAADKPVRGQGAGVVPEPARQVAQTGAFATAAGRLANEVSRPGGAAAPPGTAAPV